MDIMNGILEILKYILPSLVVFLTTWYLASGYFRNEENKRKQQLTSNNQNLITPLRLQAYERIILYLERISPESLVLRVSRQGMTAQQLQQELLTAIRAEYEHNLSQQIYLSHESWERMKKAKNSVIELVNVTAESVNKEQTAFDLSRLILEKLMAQKENPIADAIVFIKKEINRQF
jgi:hypothetical protein